MARKRNKPAVVREAAAGYGVTQVSASELKNGWHRWLERVSEGGQTVIVTRYGKPIATLSPVRFEGQSRRIFGALAGSVTEEGDLVSPTSDPWEAEG